MRGSISISYDLYQSLATALAKFSEGLADLSETEFHQNNIGLLVVLGDSILPMPTPSASTINIRPNEINNLGLLQQSLTYTTDVGIKELEESSGLGSALAQIDAVVNAVIDEPQRKQRMQGDDEGTYSGGDRETRNCRARSGGNGRWR